MRDAFGEARQRLAREIDSHPALPSEPIAADPWVISSLLQKSIRRGESGIAQRAALTLFKLRGRAVWRRFMVIAFEDVGIGSVKAVTVTVAAGSDAAWRKNCGGDFRLAAHLACILAEAPKDRSADYLVGAKDHPALAVFAQAMANVPIEARLSSLRDNALTLQERAVATGFASRLGSPGEGAGSERDFDTLLASFRELGVPNDLVVATGIAVARTRKPIVAMVPLIWLAADNGQEAKVCDCRVPPLVTAGDVPLYALDEHTWLGREAIWRFACENGAVRACLARFVPASQRRRAAHVAAFYVDAAPVAKRLLWAQSESLEAFGIERDLMVAGVASEGIGPLLEALRANLDHLNELRAQVLARAQPAQAPSPTRRRVVP